MTMIRQANVERQLADVGLAPDGIQERPVHQIDDDRHQRGAGE